MSFNKDGDAPLVFTLRTHVFDDFQSISDFLRKDVHDNNSINHASWLLLVGKIDTLPNSNI